MSCANRARHLRPSVRCAAVYLLALVPGLTASAAHAAIPTGSALTYQGRLINGGVPYDGGVDLLFTLYDAAVAGNVIGSPQQYKDIAVTNGLFTVDLDFGFTAYNGDARWLNIEVRAPHDPADSLPFTPLTPRQALSASPFALQTKGIHVDHANGFVGIGRKARIATAEVFGLYRPGTGFGGMYMQTDGMGLPFYGYEITPGPFAHHFLDGTENAWKLSLNGPIRLKVRNDGLVEGDTFNAYTQFMIGESHALSMPGVGNLFVGKNAGSSNSSFNNTFVGLSAGENTGTGGENAYFGWNAGLLNTTGYYNSFFGSRAGIANIDGHDNSIFGFNAGSANVSGSHNAFFGVDAGHDNLADGNSFFGRSAGYANTTATRNSFFGLDAGRFTTTGSDNCFFGFNAGQQNQVGDANAFFGTYAGRANLGRHNSFFGYSAGFDNSLGRYNSFFGSFAGQNNTSGENNAFFGYAAGASNQTGLANAFFGYQAGRLSNGTNNSFFGADAGEGSHGNNNTCMGRAAGEGLSSGHNNTILGVNAGFATGAGGDNVVVGYSAGIAATGSLNTLIGTRAGEATTSGGSNTFIGSDAGDANTTGSSNTALGRSADVPATATFATAIGAGAVANASNQVTLGRAADTVRIPGSLVVTGTVSKGGGSFRIDHPLDPENKWLYHSFVESPDMMNIYNGNVTTDDNGRAVVELPAYFEALNRDFRYQLTVIGQFAQAIVESEIAGGRFVIRTDKPGVKVSWQVTGIRHDPWARQNRIPVEADKQPDAYGVQPVQ